MIGDVYDAVQSTLDAPYTQAHISSYITARDALLSELSGVCVPLLRHVALAGRNSSTEDGGHATQLKPATGAAGEQISHIDALQAEYMDAMMAALLDGEGSDGEADAGDSGVRPPTHHQTAIQSSSAAGEVQNLIQDCFFAFDASKAGAQARKLVNEHMLQPWLRARVNAERLSGSAANCSQDPLKVILSQYQDALEGAWNPILQASGGSPRLEVAVSCFWVPLWTKLGPLLPDMFNPADCSAFADRYMVLSQFIVKATEILQQHTDDATSSPEDEAEGPEPSPSLAHRLWMDAPFQRACKAVLDTCPSYIRIAQSRLLEPLMRHFNAAPTACLLSPSTAASDPRRYGTAIGDTMHTILHSTTTKPWCLAPSAAGILAIGLASVRRLHAFVDAAASATHSSAVSTTDRDAEPTDLDVSSKDQAANDPLALVKRAAAHHWRFGALDAAVMDSHVLPLLALAADAASICAEVCYTPCWHNMRV